MVNSTNTMILTAILQKLNQPYTVEDGQVFIQATTSPLGELLPGVWCIQEDGSTVNVVDLSTFDATEWLTSIIQSLAETM
jgi:hypothetical protein